MTEFLDMGGYAAYVWPAYGITLATLILNVWWARRRHRDALRRARELRGAERAQRRPTVRKLQ